MTVHKLLSWISALVIACAAMASVAPAAQAAPVELTLNPFSIVASNTSAPAPASMYSGLDTATSFTLNSIEGSDFYFSPNRRIVYTRPCAFVVRYDFSMLDIPEDTSFDLIFSFYLTDWQRNIFTLSSASSFSYFFRVTYSDGSQFYYPEPFAANQVSAWDSAQVFRLLPYDYYFSETSLSYRETSRGIPLYLDFLVSTSSFESTDAIGPSQGFYVAVSPLKITYDPDKAFQDGLLGILRSILEFFTDTLPDFFGTIVEAVMLIPSTILQGIHDAFIPDTEFMLEFTEGKEELLEEQFGAIWDAVDIIVDVYTELTDNFGEFDAQHPHTFHFPGISVNLLGNEFEIEEAYVPYWPGNLDGSKFQSAVRFLLSGMVFFGWITGMVRIYERRFGISQEDSADPEEEEPY